MKETLRKYVKGCQKCQESKPSNQKPLGFLHPVEPSVEPWTDISMDFVTPLPKTRKSNAGILVVVDKLTKMAHTIPIPEHYDAPFIASLLHKNIHRYHGPPSSIVCDRDSIFMSNFWNAVCKPLQLKLRPSSAYHPESDGQTEVMNKIFFEAMLRCFVDRNQSDWDEYIIDIEIAYNSSIN